MTEVKETGTNFTAKRRATGTETVVVCCNLPNGHILQIYHVEEVTFMRDGHPVKENIATLDPSKGRWALRGPVNRSSLAAIGRDDRLPDDYRLIKGSAPDTGYALTYGIPRAFYEEWERINAKSPLVTNHHVFAAASESSAVAMAREFRDVKSGLQPLDPQTDDRVPNGKSIRKFGENDMNTGNSPKDEELEDA